MKTILVTGATGTTGAATLQFLLARGADVRVMTRQAAKAADFEARGIPAVVADYADAASLARALEGVEKAFLVNPATLDIPRHEKAFIDAAKKAGVKKIVAISVGGADARSPMALGRMHAEVEDYLQKSGMAYTILRPQSFMQNLLGNLPTIHGQGAIYSNLGDGKAPLIDARDIGEVAAVVLTGEGHDGKIYELTGPASVSFHDIARAFSGPAGKTVQYIAVPDEAARQAMVGAGFPGWLADDLVAFFGYMRTNEVKPTGDLAKVLGHPGHTLEAFTRDYSPAFKA